MDVNRKMWVKHKAALLNGIKNATDPDMQARFTELLVNIVEQEVMADTVEIDVSTEKSAGLCAVHITEENTRISKEDMMQKEFQELTEAAMPMLEYLNKHYNPHTTAVITEGRVKIVSDEIGCPLPVRD